LPSDVTEGNPTHCAFTTTGHAPQSKAIQQMHGIRHAAEDANSLVKSTFLKRDGIVMKFRSSTRLPKHDSLLLIKERLSEIAIQNYGGCNYCSRTIRREPYASSRG